MIKGYSPKTTCASPARRRLTIQSMRIMGTASGCLVSSSAIRGCDAATACACAEARATSSPSNQRSASASVGLRNLPGEG